LIARAHITGSKDTRIRRAQTRIDLHPQASVVPDPGLFEPQTLDVGYSASRHQERIHHRFARLSSRVSVAHDFERSTRCHLSNFSASCYFCPTTAQSLVHDGCGLRICTWQGGGFALEERRLGPEPLQGLRQLAANGAATNHPQPRRALGESKNALVGQIAT